MSQTEIDKMLQDAQKYKAENYLALATKLLYKNKQLSVKIITAEWTVYTGGVHPMLLLKLVYVVDGQEIHVDLVEAVFKDYNRRFDSNIGIKPDMDMRTKVILRLAYILYSHCKD